MSCSGALIRCSPRYRTSHHSDLHRFLSYRSYSYCFFSSANPVQENRDPAYVLVFAPITTSSHFSSSTWGLAAITAYRTYKDPSSLQYAQSTWKQLVAFLVTPEHAVNGTHPMRNVSIPATCNGGKPVVIHRFPLSNFFQRQLLARYSRYVVSMVIAQLPVV